MIKIAEISWLTLFLRWELLTSTTDRATLSKSIEYKYYSGQKQAFNFFFLLCNTNRTLNVNNSGELPEISFHFIEQAAVYPGIMEQHPVKGGTTADV